VSRYLFVLNTGLKFGTLGRLVARICEGTEIGWTRFGLFVRRTMRLEKSRMPKTIIVEKPRLANGIL